MNAYKEEKLVKSGSCHQTFNSGPIKNVTPRRLQAFNENFLEQRKKTCIIQLHNSQRGRIQCLNLTSKAHIQPNLIAILRAVPLRHVATIKVIINVVKNLWRSSFPVTRHSPHPPRHLIGRRRRRGGTWSWSGPIGKEEAEAGGRPTRIGIQLWAAAGGWGRFLESQAPQNSLTQEKREVSTGFQSKSVGPHQVRIQTQGLLLHKLSFTRKAFGSFAPSGLTKRFQSF